MCLKETNKYISSTPRKGQLNKTELAKKLGIDAKTLAKYLGKAVNTKQIKYIDNGLLILNKFIISSFIPTDSFSQVYHIIYDWCIDNDIIPPDMNDEIR